MIVALIVLIAGGLPVIGVFTARLLWQHRDAFIAWMDGKCVDCGSTICTKCEGCSCPHQECVCDQMKEDYTKSELIVVGDLVQFRHKKHGMMIGFVEDFFINSDGIKEAIVTVRNLSALPSRH